VSAGGTVLCRLASSLCPISAEDVDLQTLQITLCPACAQVTDPEARQADTLSGYGQAVSAWLLGLSCLQA